ncbi:hypothetical protein [Candidatus Similichlamydia laticola]|uniref:Transmembrane protein n=1 Tax=Candidatus Similichlamydia laticola TaxID=2170265 RepID=A0A369KEB5_9BACT|nr:hypothetical protein [Candidatus Similichlamydia laticola]RDB31247.1 hypothetical protein HAT2_00650 [Candidatus Similichlamydia laticola]
MATPPGSSSSTPYHTPPNSSPFSTPLGSPMVTRRGSCNPSPIETVVALANASWSSLPIPVPFPSEDPSQEEDQGAMRITRGVVLARLEPTRPQRRQCNRVFAQVCQFMTCLFIIVLLILVLMTLGCILTHNCADNSANSNTSATSANHVGIPCVLQVFYVVMLWMTGLLMAGNLGLFYTVGSRRQRNWMRGSWCIIFVVCFSLLAILIKACELGIPCSKDLLALYLWIMMGFLFYTIALSRERMLLPEESQHGQEETENGSELGQMFLEENPE